MNGAFGGDLDAGESAQDTLADFAGAPTAVLTFHVENKIFYLKGKLMSMTVGTTLLSLSPLDAARLGAIKNLIASLARNSKFPAEFSHRLAGEPQTAVSHPLPNTPSKPHSLPKRGKSVTYVSGTICYLCLRSLICFWGTNSD